MRKRKITLAMLERKNACGDGRELFKKLFGEEAWVTHENVDRAVADDDFLNYFGWLVDRFLSVKQARTWWKFEQKSWDRFQIEGNRAFSQFARGASGDAVHEFLKREHLRRLGHEFVRLYLSPAA